MSWHGYGRIETEEAEVEEDDDDGDEDLDVLDEELFDHEGGPR